MPKSTQDQLLIAEFIKEIDETAEQFRELLQNLHNIEEHKLDFVELKTKLTIDQIRRKKHDPWEEQGQRNGRGYNLPVLPKVAAPVQSTSTQVWCSENNR